jgi:hypothetical protein
MNQRFEQVDARFVGIEGRFVALDTKIDRHFTWLVGIEVAALVGSYYK